MLTAKTADFQELYEQSVQSPEQEVDFIHRAYRKKNGRNCVSMREDFCGSAALATSWVRSDPLRTAVGIDLEPKVLAWAEKHHRSTLTPEQQKRLKLLEQDVRTPPKEKFDAVVAYNYSWWIFKTHKDLLKYFQSARKGTAKDGMFFLDIFGGSLGEQVSIEPRKYRNFTYIWEQASFNPIDGNFLTHIHFEFKDKTRLNKAFTYDWRLWRLPEAREILLEAGFSKVDIYWEDTDKRGNASGNFRIQKKVENESSWSAYIVAHA